MVMQKGEVVAVCISQKRGELKNQVDEGRLIENFGLENDGHGGHWDRQVSLLAAESIERGVKEYNLKIKPGDFAENIITRGIDLVSLPVGTQLKVGSQAVLEVTQIGKEDHESIVTRTLGVSLIPKEGAFAKVVHGGPVRSGDPIEVLN